jgi:hypothetical protein
MSHFRIFQNDLRNIVRKLWGNVATATTLMVVRTPEPFGASSWNFVWGEVFERLTFRTNFYLFHACHMSHPSNSPQFDHPNSMSWNMQIMKLLIMQLLHQYFFCLLGPNILLSSLFTNTLNLCSYFRVETEIHTDTKQHVQLQSYSFLYFTHSVRAGVNMSDCYEINVSVNAVLRISTFLWNVRNVMDWISHRFSLNEFPLW